MSFAFAYLDLARMRAPKGTFRALIGRERDVPAFRDVRLGILETPLKKHVYLSLSYNSENISEKLYNYKFLSKKKLIRYVFIVRKTNRAKNNLSPRSHSNEETR